MHDRNYTASFTVNQSPRDVFAAINNVRGWWSEEIEGDTDRLNAEFTFHYREHHRTTQKIIELVPGEKVVWRVVKSHINFVANKEEWKGTDIVFEIVPKGGKTELRFTHVGLTPAGECYDSCSEGWNFYFRRSLRSLITTGQGEPARAE